MRRQRYKSEEADTALCVSASSLFTGIFYNKFMSGGLLIITLIFYNVSIGCNLVDGAKSVYVD